MLVGKSPRSDFSLTPEKTITVAALALLLVSMRTQSFWLLHVCLFALWTMAYRSVLRKSLESLKSLSLYLWIVAFCVAVEAVLIRLSAIFSLAPLQSSLLPLTLFLLSQSLRTAHKRKKRDPVPGGDYVKLDDRS